MERLPRHRRKSLRACHPDVGARRKRCVGRSSPTRSLKWPRGEPTCSRSTAWGSFLATVRADGGPRLHPMCPVLAEGGLYAFIVPSPKGRDLLRDGRYAMHAFTPEDVDDEFSVWGAATSIGGGALRGRLVAGYHSTLPEGSTLFEFDVAHALLSRYRHRGDWPPSYSIWHEHP